MSESRNSSNILSESRLHDILTRINNVRIGIIGDGALDVYWEADMTKSELSRETPHFPLPVIKERYSGGGGANVAANISALKPACVTMIAVIGKDWRGDLFINTLKGNNINAEYLVVSEERVTPAYCKPIRRGFSGIEYEDPRIDFQNYSALAPAEEQEVISNLEKMSREVDIIAVADQLLFGTITENVRKKLQEISEAGIPVVADSRDRIGSFSGVIVKPNETEACRVVDPLISPTGINDELIHNAARELHLRNNRPAIITLGPRGALWIEDGMITNITIVPEEPPIDICGAGDTFMSAFISAFAAGASGSEAIAIANLASAVTVKKIGMTGTATREEIIDKHRKRSGK